MMVSIKMVDGSRIDVPLVSECEDNIFDILSSNGDCVWCEAYSDNNKRIILRTNNIVSVTVHKGEGDDS